ncbi:MAG: TadE/TadG family type IV pilus assembly protein, partial [Polyangiales bacterium]
TAAPEAAPRRTAPRLGDERGAIMVMAVFMATFLVGMLFYLIGLGESLLFRQDMQDAADSVAQAGAVVHARGMNILVLLNIAMAALMAVLVALRTVQVLAAAAAAITAALCPIPFCQWACPFPGPAMSLHYKALGVYEKTKKYIFPMIRLTHCLEEGVKYAMPLAAQGRAISMAMVRSDGSKKVGFIVPIYRGLPVEDDPTQLCGKAGEFAGSLAAKPFKYVVPGLDRVVGKMIGGLTSRFAPFFCGITDEPPPRLESPVDDVVPKPPSEAMRQCNRYRGQDENEARRLCDEAQRDVARYQVDPESGACSAGAHNPDTDPAACQQLVEKASKECKPRSPSDRFSAYYWQERVVDVKLIKEGDKTKVLSRTLVHGFDDKPNPRLIERSVKGNRRGNVELHYPPKGGGGAVKLPCGTVKAEYSQDYRVPEDDKDDEPICYEVIPASRHWGDRQPARPKPPKDSGIIVERRREVTRIIRCGRHKKTGVEDWIDESDRLGNDNSDTLPPGNEDVRAQAQQSSKLSTCGRSLDPMRVIEGVPLGSERLQLRAIIFGYDDLPGGLSERAVQVAVWNEAKGRELRDSLLGRLGHLGRLQAAQSEFFYNGDEDPSEWMWHMKWRARLRRLRLPAEDPSPAAEGDDLLAGDPASACASQGGPARACSKA